MSDEIFVKIMISIIIFFITIGTGLRIYLQWDFEQWKMEEQKKYYKPMTQKELDEYKPATGTRWIDITVAGRTYKFLVVE